MTREDAIHMLIDLINPNDDSEEAVEMAIQALSQEPLSEIKENISKYMKKYPNHVGNIDFWNGFYACRNIVEHLDEDEQEPICDRDCEHCTWTECPIEPCDDAISVKIGEQQSE